MNSRTIFLSLVFLSVLGIAYFTAKVYSMTLRFSPALSKICFLITLFVSLLFVASFVMTRMLSYGIGPIFYTFIHTLAGIFFYIFIGAMALGIVATIFSVLSIPLPIFIPVLFLITSLLFGIGGIIQARFITVKQYSVTLPNADDSWNGKHAVLVTDTHFGLVNYEKFSDKVVGKILEINPDFVMHAGDFYDGPKIDTTPITLSWRKLASKIPVFYAPGNHELYGDYGSFINSIREASVTVLDNKKTLYDGVQIAGLTYYDGKAPIEAKDVIQKLEIDPTIPSILINHPPTSLAAANESGFDLMVSGHTHNGQFWPNTYLVRRVYGIYYYGLKKYNDMQVLTSSGVGTFGPPLRLFNTPEIVIITFKNKQ